MSIDQQSIRNKALRLLARREHARGELQQKLFASLSAVNDVDDSDAPQALKDAIETVLDDFCQRGWLSDERFAEQWVHARAQRYGAQRLAQELRIRGVAPEIIEAALAQDRDAELARAHAIWQRKFGQAAQDLREKQRQFRFLASRGFSGNIISAILNGWQAED